MPSVIPEVVDRDSVSRYSANATVIVELNVGYIDTNAAALTYLPSAPVLPILDSLEVPITWHSGHLSLRLLGASHQVVLETESGNVAETVACLSDAKQPMPPRYSSHQGGLSYQFTSTVTTLEPARFRRSVARLRERANVDQNWLAGVFPGDANALTVLAFQSEPNLIAWHTFHVYPRESQIVNTFSIVCGTAPISGIVGL